MSIDIESEYVMRLLSVVLILLLCVPVMAQDDVKVISSHYVGWEHWQVAWQNGIFEEVGIKYNINFTFEMYDEYMPSVEDFKSGKAHFCTMTNNEAFYVACDGLNVEAVVFGDISNGNDAVIAKKGITLDNLLSEPRQVLLEKVSLSELVWKKFLEKHKLPADNFTIVDIATLKPREKDDLATTFKRKRKIDLIVTWNPWVMQIGSSVGGAHILFTSEETEGLIQDLLVGNSNVLKANPDIGYALAEIHWRATDLLFNSDDATRLATLNQIANNCNVTQDGKRRKWQNQDFHIEQQLETTLLFAEPNAALKYLQRPIIKSVAEEIIAFNGDCGASIQLPNGSKIGGSKNVFWYNTTYMEHVAASR